jgi:hypothetical protein
MLSLLNLKSSKTILLIPVGLILLFVLARFSFGGFNFSHFIVAGSDFVHQESVAPNTIINEGQGYDGQFFYRYAHNPLNSEKTAYGVTVDHIEYRIQRIIYPATVWLFSFGGNKNLIPFFLVFCNALAFIGIFYLSLKLCEKKKVNKTYALLPIFLFGAYMSLARDTSEIFEIFFFGLAIYSIIINNIYTYTLSILLAIFSRETSLIAIAPLTLFYGLSMLKLTKFQPRLILRLLILGLPFIAIILWKYYLQTSINSERLVDGSHNLSLPFVGMYKGAQSSLNFSGFKNTIETLYWFTYFFWNVWFLVVVIKRINFKTLFSLNVQSMLSLTYLIWAIFSLFLGHAIYVDDWGFVRIFALWNLLGFIIIMLANISLKKSFLAFSIIVLILTLVRLIIRV